MLRVVLLFALIYVASASHRSCLSEPWGALGTPNPECFSLVTQKINKYTTSVKVLLSGSKDDSVAAWGNWSDNIELNGWALLDIHTSDEYEASTQAYAAGFLEGAVASTRIKQTFVNGDEFLYKYNPGVLKFMEENLNWTAAQIEANPEDAYWKYIAMTLVQTRGLAAGYRTTDDWLQLPLDHIDFMLLELDDETSDIAEYVSESNTSKKRGDTKFEGDHCSALIKLLEDGSDIYTSHNTWASYHNMLKVFKYYDFSYAPKIVFSCHPGMIFSNDDFYQMSTGLVSLETTLSVYNNDLYKELSPKTVPEWQRTMVANALATTGPEWVELFSRYNSGTYCNQWMVVDYNLFTPGEDLQENTLWVLEQLPNLIVAEDQTDSLAENHYWGSFNRAFYPEIQEKCGQNDMVAKYGNYYSHDACARSLIFARDQASVSDMEAMQNIMSYNDYQNDPLSLCSTYGAVCDPPYSAILAVAARCELNPSNGTYSLDDLGHSDMGAIDVKITSYERVGTLSTRAYAGPTYVQQPVFDWDTVDLEGLDARHAGQPIVWDFPWIDAEW